MTKPTTSYMEAHETYLASEREELKRLLAQRKVRH